MSFQDLPIVASSQPEEDEEEEEGDEADRRETVTCSLTSQTAEVGGWLPRGWLRVPIRGTTRRFCGAIVVEFEKVPFTVVVAVVVVIESRRCCKAAAAASSSAVGIGGSGRFGGGGAIAR